MEKKDKKYEYIRELIDKSGIDFSSVQKSDILSTCQIYKGKISKENYLMAIQVIMDLYGNGAN